MASTRDAQSKKLNRTTFWLVVGTWALVAVSMVSAWIVWCGTTRQVDELRRATELAWRPYLDINHREPINYSLIYRAGESESTDTVGLLIDSIPLNSPSFMAVRMIGFGVHRNLEYKNSGTTPLRITAAIVSTLSEYEWCTKYQKSIESFVEDIRGFDELKPRETDFFIRPGGSYNTEEPKGLNRRMPKSDFLKSVDSGRVILYPYTYVEYEDFFGGKYSTILVQYMSIEVDTANNIAILARSAQPGIEKYRWDVLLDEQ